MNAKLKTISGKVAVHQGQNIKRIRTLLGIQQKALAAALGAGWTQKKVSRVESSSRVMLKTRKELAKYFEVDLSLFDSFDAAAGRLALNYVIKLQDQLAGTGDMDDRQLLADITRLLENASVSIQREKCNMELLLKLFERVNIRSATWQAVPPSELHGEVKESAFCYLKAV